MRVPVIRELLTARPLGRGDSSPLCCTVVLGAARLFGVAAAVLAGGAVVIVGRCVGALSSTWSVCTRPAPASLVGLDARPVSVVRLGSAVGAPFAGSASLCCDAPSVLFVICYLLHI